MTIVDIAIRRSSALAGALIGLCSLTCPAPLDALDAPALPTWETSAPGQQGQLTLYNAKLNGGFYGMPVEMGDFDGDGNTDFAVATMGADSAPQPDRVTAGEVFILRGGGVIEGEIDRAAFSPETAPGLTLSGAWLTDFLGTKIVAADVNGDGIDDLAIGAQNWDDPRGDRPTCGGVFIVLGRPGLLDDGSVIDLRFALDAPPADVVVVLGERAGDRLGVWLHAGDLDGDGLADLAIGGDQSSGADPDAGGLRVGMAAIVYGRAELPPFLDLATANELDDVSLLYGRDTDDHFGSTTYVEDLDGDGLADLVVAAAMNRLSAAQMDLHGGGDFPARGAGGGSGPDNSRFFAGEVNVLFSTGTPGERLPARIDFASELPAALAARLAVIHGAVRGSTAGEELTSGDVDGDGLPELILGAIAADSPLGLRVVGAGYVIYGVDRLRGATLDLAAPVGQPEGVAVSELWGLADFSLFADSISVADFDRDGFDDIALSIPIADRHFNAPAEPGMVAIVYGQRERLPRHFVPEKATAGTAPRVSFARGTDGGDKMGYSMATGDFDGDGWADLSANAMRAFGKDNAHPNAGDAYVISGYHLTGQRLEVHGVTPAGAETDESTSVTVHGRAFTIDGDVSVEVGGEAAADVEVVDARTLRAVFPASATSGARDVTVTTRHGTATLPSGFVYHGDDAFLRGDTDASNELQLDDAVRTLDVLFRGVPAVCLDAHDTDDDGAVTITDALRTLNYLFRDAPPPPAPFPTAGLDPTEDALRCP